MPERWQRNGTAHEADAPALRHEDLNARQRGLVDTDRFGRVMAEARHGTRVVGQDPPG